MYIGKYFSSKQSRLDFTFWTVGLVFIAFCEYIPHIIFNPLIVMAIDK